MKKSGNAIPCKYVNFYNPNILLKFALLWLYFFYRIEHRIEYFLRFVSSRRIFASLPIAVENERLINWALLVAPV